MALVILQQFKRNVDRFVQASDRAVFLIFKTYRRTLVGRWHALYLNRNVIREMTA